MSDHPARPPWYATLFQPILAGATLRERALACLGATIGIALVVLVGTLVPAGENLPLLATSVGASAVLVFVVPASPMAQPWPVIGGNVICALIGAAIAWTGLDLHIALPLAGGLAIAAMSLTRSLHPPGAATALAAVFIGPSSSLAFVLAPVALDAVVIVLAAIGFHRLCGRRYPHVAIPPTPPAASGLNPSDIDAALASLDETFDIDRADLDRLLAEAARHATLRRSRR